MQSILPRLSDVDGLLLVEVTGERGLGNAEGGRGVVRAGGALASRQLHAGNQNPVVARDGRDGAKATGLQPPVLKEGPLDGVREIRVEVHSFIRGFRHVGSAVLVVVVLVDGGGVHRQDEEAVSGQAPPLRAAPDAPVVTAEPLKLPAAFDVGVEDAVQSVLVSGAKVDFLAIVHRVVFLVLHEQSLEIDLRRVLGACRLLVGAESLLLVKDPVGRRKRFLSRHARQPFCDRGGQLRACRQTRGELKLYSVLYSFVRFGATNSMLTLRFLKLIQI